MYTLEISVPLASNAVMLLIQSTGNAILGVKR